jgi:hypothetical protein
MKSPFVSAALSALVYCQALLIFAGVATVLLRDRSDDGQLARSAEARPAIATSRI